MTSAKYFVYYTIIFRGPFFRGHTVVVTYHVWQVVDSTENIIKLRKVQISIHIQLYYTVKQNHCKWCKPFAVNTS